MKEILIQLDHINILIADLDNKSDGVNDNETNIKLRDLYGKKHSLLDTLSRRINLAKCAVSYKERELTLKIKAS